MANQPYFVRDGSKNDSTFQYDRVAAGNGIDCQLSMPLLWLLFTPRPRTDGAQGESQRKVECRDAESRTVRFSRDHCQVALSRLRDPSLDQVSARASREVHSVPITCRSPQSRPPCKRINAVAYDRSPAVLTSPLLRP